jgi:hypothetical protein
MSKLMPFVELDDMQQGLPPFYFESMRIRSFVLPASLPHLWAWCNKVLNIAPDHRFVPVAPLVTLGINQYPRMVTLNPEYAGKVGYTQQNEFYFLFPVLHLQRQWGIWMPHEITWAYPYIGVDCATSAFTGREVLGFSKMLGSISFVEPVSTSTAASTDAFESEVAMPGFRALGPTVPEEQLKLAAVRTGAPILNPTGQASQFPWTLLHAAKQAGMLSGFANNFFALEDLIENIVADMLTSVDPSLFSVINLKQFRHPASPQLAAYQSLDTCRFRQIGLSPIKIYDGGTVKLWDNPTTSPVRFLGLGNSSIAVAEAQTPNGTIIEPLLVTGYDTDMWFGEADTIWSCP